MGGKLVHCYKQICQSSYLRRNILCKLTEKQCVQRRLFRTEVLADGVKFASLLYRNNGNIKRNIGNASNISC